MKKILVFVVIIAGILGLGMLYRDFFKSQPNEKVYVAIEGESKIVVIDPVTKSILSTINLAVEHDGGLLPYAPHNVQVSPDMKTVWVTANAGMHQGHTSLMTNRAYAHGGVGEGADEVIVINPDNDRIIKRLPLGNGLHLAHVVLTPDSAWALVTAQNEGAIYKINTRTFALEKKILLPRPVTSAGSPEPHGLRVAHDGSAAYLAILKGKSMGVLDLVDDSITTVPLGGAAVQTGVTPDGKFVVVSLYDTKQLAVYEVTTKKVRFVKLPSTARGPVQMYPTPDSRFVYLADQGYYFGQPPSEWVYKIDLQKLAVVEEIRAGRGPHGVVVSPDGLRLYVTNLLSDDLTVIDTITDKETERISVGKEPNGVSVWLKQ